MWQTTDERPAIAYTAEESSAMDRWLERERGFTVQELMGTAGRRLADAVRELVADRALFPAGAARAVFLVGPGNNGGDALVAAAELSGELPTEIWRPLVEQAGLPGRESPTARGAGRAGKAAGAPLLDERTLLVDGLFGVGLARPITGAAREAVERVNASPAVVLAVDVPSGLSATSGAIVGVSAADPRGGVAVRADRTLTFVGPKAGFFAGAGREHVGLWRAVDIGFPVAEAEVWVAARRAAPVR